MAQQQPPRLNGINPLAYMGVNPTAPANFQTPASRAPTTTDTNFKIGDEWLWQTRVNPNPVQARLWVLVGLTGGVATWDELTFNGANQFPTNAGVAIPVAGVLNILGDTLGILTSGAGNTVTISTSGAVALRYFTDNGIAIPDGGNLHVNGGPNINTEANPDTSDNLLVNLNTSIIQPATTADASAGVYSLGAGSIAADRFMHAYGTNNTFLGSQAGNFTLTVVDAINNTGIGEVALNSLTTGSNNVAVGAGSLDIATTASNCTSIGNESQVLNVSGNNNVSLGSGSLGALSDSSENTAIGTGSLAAFNGAATPTLNTAVGYQSLAALTTGTTNQAFGTQAGNALLTGADNLLIGYLAGNQYTGAESSNINIGANGVTGESNVIRIGTQGTGAGQQNAAYMAGVYQGAGSNQVVLVGTTGVLGSSAGTDGQVLIGATGGSPAWANITSLDDSITVTNTENGIDLSTVSGGGDVVFSAYLQTTLNNTTGAGALYQIVMDTVTVNIGGGFNLGTGLFTAPVAGAYLFTFCATVQPLLTGEIGAMFLTTNSGAIWRINTDSGGWYNARDTTNNRYSSLGSVIIPCALNEQIGFAIRVFNGATNTLSILGATDIENNTPGAFFTGALMATM